MLLHNSQMDGGSNKSIANDIIDLEAYWEIDPIQINGVASNVKVECTHNGIYQMVARSGNATPILIHD